MKQKKNISPSIEEAKQRIELYNKLSYAMRDLSHDEKLQVLMLLAVYMNLLECNQLMERRGLRPVRYPGVQLSLPRWAVEGRQSRLRPRNPQAHRGRIHHNSQRT